MDTSDNTDPNAGYKTPDTEDPEPTPPPDDYSDPPVGGLLPPDSPTGRSVGYYFDRAGNRQQVTDTANPTINYVQNNINEYKTASGSIITNGSEHEINSFQGLYDTQLVTYQYLNDEHLINVWDSGGSRYFYYDALGRCVKRSPTMANNGNTTYYIYDGEKPILEYSSTGIVGRNVYGKGIDEILMRTDPGVNGGYPFYYAQDHEGSVTHLLDGRSSPASQTGNVIEQYHYDAFGLPTFYNANTNQINSTAYNNRFLFTGREYAATYRGIYVPEFRFYEYRARAYHPDLGRFMSEDSKLFDAGDYNLFRYCHNDPIDFTDAMGLQDDQPYPKGPNHDSPLIELSKRQLSFDRGFAAVFTQLAAREGLTMGQEQKTNSKPEAQSLEARAVQMLGEETRSKKTQAGAVIDGSPYRVGPVDEKVVRRDPRHPTLGNIPEGREAFRFVQANQNDRWFIVHYHHQVGREGLPTDEWDRKMSKDAPMYFTNKEWAKRGDYQIIRYGAKPEWHHDSSIIPDN